MKVLIVSPHIEIPGLSGAAIHHTEFSKALAKLGIEVHILADSKKEIKLSKNTFLHPSEVSSIPPKRFFTSMNSIKNVVEICRKYKIEIIHDRCDPGQIAGYLASKFLDTPRVSEINENQLSYEIKGSFLRDVILYPFVISFKKFWVTHIAPDSEIVVTVSKTIRDSMVKLGVDPKKIVTISNGANASSGGKPLSLKKFGIKEDDIVATIIGELGPRQGILEIVQVVNEVGIPNFKLILVGGEERYKNYLRRVRKFVAENGLEKKIIFINKIEHEKIKNFLTSVDFALAPYRESWNKESFGFCPLKVLDYMAAGKVVIASDTKWMRELIENKKDGFLVPFESFGKGMSDIIKNLSQKKKKIIERNAREKIRKHFTWEEVARRYKTIYEKLI